jgi:hypothetical protein
MVTPHVTALSTLPTAHPTAGVPAEREPGAAPRPAMLLEPADPVAAACTGRSRRPVRWRRGRRLALVTAR